MKSYLGLYQPSPGAPQVEATILIFDKTLHVGFRNESGQTITRQWELQYTDASFRLASQSTILRNRHEGNMEISIQGKDAVDHIKSFQEEQLRPWHKKRKARDWTKAGMLLVLIAVGLVAIYFLLVPWISEKLALGVSRDTERQFGEAAYSAMGLESTQHKAATADVNLFFDAMQVKSDYPIHITVINEEIINAFALPGGRIVVYSALLDKMESYPELAALLSHEFTHVNNRHSTKSIFRRLGSKVFISLLFGKLGSVTSILADHADNLKSLKYSRRLEKEADLEGLALLKERKIDPKGFANLFRHLSESAPTSALPELLASHPDIQHRIDYISDASDKSQVEENTRLKSIFESLKQNIKQ